MATEKYLRELEKCIICGSDIIYYDTKIAKDGKIKSGKSALTKKTTGHNLKVCENCLIQKFPEWKDKNKSRVFNFMNPITKFAFDIDDEIYENEKQKYVVKSEENFIRKYGIDEGKKRWERYKNKQSYTNTFEYKNKVYGMTKEEFKEFNDSRAITKKNLIRRWGVIEGTTKWENYLEKRRVMGSFDYLVEKYGLSKARKINKSKAQTLENFILKWGEEDGPKKYDEYWSKLKTYSSKVANNFFTKLDEYFKEYTTYFAAKNVEYGVNLGGSYIKLDYYILELNICIEFNGTIFHADPKVFKADERPNPWDKKITAKEIWQKDAERIGKLFERRGITTIIVWQKDVFDNFDFKTFANNIKNI